METRRASEDPEERKKIERGWCYGSQAFRDELLAQMNEKKGVEHCGQEIRESAEANAERIVKHELKKHHWDEGELTRRRKGDPSKITIAQRLRKETTMTSAWIAARLQMGTKSHLSHLLYWHKHDKKKSHSLPITDKI